MDNHHIGKIIGTRVTRSGVTNMHVLCHREHINFSMTTIMLCNYASYFEAEKDVMYVISLSHTVTVCSAFL